MAKNRILVVEDDPDISEIITLNLQYSEYEYMALDDGLKTIEYLQKDHAFDLTILDIMLPGADGFTLMEYMCRYNIPMLCLTAKADVSSKMCIRDRYWEAEQNHKVSGYRDKHQHPHSQAAWRRRCIAAH